MVILDIKLLVLDIDGTIAGISNDVNHRVRQAIKAVQNQGIKVTIATGRMYCSALRFQQIIDSKLPLIAYNGAWIQNPLTEEIYYHIPIGSTIARELLDYFEQSEFKKSVEIHCYLEDELYVREITQTTEIYAQRSGVQPNVTKDLRTIINQNTTKILALCHEQNIITILKKELSQLFSSEQIYLTQSSKIYLEAIHPTVNKGAATRYLTEEILGLKPENVMAIGDNFNDGEMLKYAGLSIAMGEAPEEIKSIAKWVAPTVEEDGVAIALEKFLNF